ncbi:TEA/ATTS domain family-domain-containing protein [Multifurca ochricompacta]|uniref:TEA/ATTS domain family-domain-containing protein n=1 Tax=Multifurca ochricompacta TaxID=376703 RepID=A0AAD4M7G3_9AGAM|nr:TEA/ATTS domain family-domain-containing protein [Multifurca ochricompacta]
MPRSLPTATPFKIRGKSKGNRSIRCIPGGNEAIWDEELHAALIEALNIYPPMGRQRIRPVHNGGEGHTSLGRCQLIQQYLMQKTGKNRTRKQISSRIQRLRRTHQDDPTMADALRVLPDVQQPITPEMLVNLNDSNESTTLSTPLIPATPPLLGSVESSARSSPSVNQPADSFHSGASSSSIQPNQSTLRLFESADLHLSESGFSAPEQENVWPGPGLHLPDRPASSLSRRRVSSNITGLRFQLDLPPVPSFSFANSGYGFEASTISAEAGHLPFAGNQFPYLSCHDQASEPITPVDQIIHTPEFPPQVLRYDKRPVYQSRYAEKDDAFFQPVTCVPSLSPYDPHNGSHLMAAAEYCSSKPSAFHTSRAQNYSFPSSPLASFHSNIEGTSPRLLSLGPEGCHGGILTQDVSHIVHLPRRLSYPCDSRLLDSALSLRMSPVVYSYVPEEGHSTNTLESLELASPAVIRPFFISDFACSAAGSSPHTPLAEMTTGSLHDGTVSQ